MIQITRVQARQFLNVLRKSVPVGTPRGQRLLLVLQVNNAGLRIGASLLEVAMELHLPGNRSVDEIMLPAEGLADVQGRTDEVVTLENHEQESVQARWNDAGVPQVHEYPIIDREKIQRCPESPKKMVPMPAGFLPALMNAGQTAAREPVRYALTRLQLRGSSGELIATDGHQVLIQNGFSFPWKEDLLVPAIPAFGCRELAQDASVFIGRSEKHVCVQVGPWTFHLLLDAEGRFPKVEAVIPSASSKATVCQLSDEDAAFLTQALPRLPGAGDQHEPITVDLKDTVTLRARGEKQERITEVVLSRSRVVGPAVQFVCNRKYLERLLQLGFKEFRVTGPEKPICCRRKDMTYAWMPLGKEGALPASENALCINSLTESLLPGKVTRQRGTIGIKDESQNQEQQLGPVATSTANGQSQNSRRPSMATNDPKNPEQHATAEPGEGIDPLIEIENLRVHLQQALASTSRLIAVLKHQRRQSRAMSAAMASLRRLQQFSR